MKVIFDTDKVDLAHIGHALKYVKDLELTKGRLSQLTIKYDNRTIAYNFWHNSKSITITSQEVKND